MTRRTLIGLVAIAAVAGAVLLGMPSAKLAEPKREAAASDGRPPVLYAQLVEGCPVGIADLDLPGSPDPDVRRIPLTLHESVSWRDPGVETSTFTLLSAGPEIGRFRYVTHRGEQPLLDTTLEIPYGRTIAVAVRLRPRACMAVAIERPHAQGGSLSVTPR